MTIVPNFKVPQINGIRYTTAYSSLQNAIDSICPTTPTVYYPNSFVYDDGGVLFHPVENWTFENGKLETHIHLPTNLTLVGANNNKSVFSWHSDSGTQSAFGFQVRKTEYGNGLPVLNVKVRDLCLKGDWHTTKSCFSADFASFNYDTSGTGSDYRKTGARLEVSKCNLKEWGKNGFEFGTEEGTSSWWGSLDFSFNRLQACRRYGYYFNGDIRQVSLYGNYIGATEITTSHATGTIEQKGGYCGIYGNGLWIAGVRDSCVEFMTEQYLSDYNHSAVFNGCWDIVVDNFYEEGNSFGISAYVVRNLKISNVYHQSNEGFNIGNCFDAIIENNTFNYVNETTSIGAILLTGSCEQVIIRNNRLIGGTSPPGIRFLSISTEPDYVEQLIMNGTPLVGSAGKFIRGRKIPVQYKNGIPSDSDFNYYECLSGSSSYSLVGPKAGLMCMDTSTGNIYVRATASWKTLSFTV